MKAEGRNRIFYIFLNETLLPLRFLSCNVISNAVKFSFSVSAALEITLGISG